MNYVGTLLGKFKDLFSQINYLTLGGASDVVVVRNPESGELHSTPFYVRFGFQDVMRPRRHHISLIVNGELSSIRMYLGESGIAYFSDESKTDDKVCTEGDDTEKKESLKMDYLEEFDEESVIAELESKIENDVAIYPNEDSQTREASPESPKSKTDKLKVSALTKINNFVKNYHRASLNRETAISMNFDLADKNAEKQLDDQLLAVYSETNKTTTKDGYIKTLHLTPQQLESLNLREGANEINFKIATAYQGTRVLTSNIFLWKSTDKVVISDVDGTVTKSDLLGHFLPLLGKQWYQDSVSRLYKKIEENGYKILYISMRPVGYSKITKKQLTSVKINETQLPHGPLILCPLTFLSSMKVEIVFKAADIMKGELVKSIVSIFGDPKCLYSGFGNNQFDRKFYTKNNVPRDKIFIINTRGEVRTALNPEANLSYAKILEDAEKYFPKI